jgi:hypothetical protein
VGTKIALTTETFNKVSDKSWIRMRMGLASMLPITLDISTFDAEHIALGYLPSGICLAKITATGLYGPYDDASLDGRQTLTGHLFEETKVAALTDPDQGGALFWTGVVRESRLPKFTGTGNLKGEIDAAGKVEVASWIKYV